MGMVAEDDLLKRMEELTVSLRDHTTHFWETWGIWGTFLDSYDMKRSLGV